MEHFYKTIEGFMDHRNTPMLDLVLDGFPTKGTWVELGSYMGRSACYCVVELLNRDKLGPFYCVDTWQGGDGLENHPLIVDNQAHENFLNNAHENFLNNIAPIKEYIIDIESDSASAAARFKDNSIDFCYVDAGHTYEDVTKDLNAWWPKIRHGCRFGGDDYTKLWPEVCQAVEDFFEEKKIKVSRIGRCWIVTKPLE